MNLRPRQKDKELGPTFHFKPNNFFEKVRDHIEYQNPTMSIHSNEVYSKSIVNRHTGMLLKNLKPAKPDLSRFNKLQDSTQK